MRSKWDWDDIVRDKPRPVDKRSLCADVATLSDCPYYSLFFYLSLLPRYKSLQCTIRGLFGITWPVPIPWLDYLLSFLLPICQIFSLTTNLVLFSSVSILQCFLSIMQFIQYLALRLLVTASVRAAGSRHRQLGSSAKMRVALCVSPLNRGAMMRDGVRLRIYFCVQSIQSSILTVSTLISECVWWMTFKLEAV